MFCVLCILLSAFSFQLSAKRSVFVCFVYFVVKFVFSFQLLAFGFQLSETFSCVSCVLWLNLSFAFSFQLSAFSYNYALCIVKRLHAKWHDNRRASSGRYVFSIQFSFFTTIIFWDCRPWRRGFLVCFVFFVVKFVFQLSAFSFQLREAADH